MPLPPGTRVDRYEVLDLLGAGGMGEVYRARDPKLERLVALKILRLDQELGAAGGARLLREARAVAALSHPNVLAVYDVGEVVESESLRGMSYIAMELVVGTSLRGYVGDGAVPMERRVAWMTAVARALAAAHDAGIVHRDVKPENVMIRFDGVVKVLDFGIARRVSIAIDPGSSTEGHSLPTLRAAAPQTPASDEPLTVAGAVAGTPYYMSPEQLRGEPLDGRTDQFSWAVVAYELLTGSPPWRRGNDAIAIVADILGVLPRPARDVEPSIPPAVAAAIDRALAKPVAQRFASMSALAESLDIERDVAAPRPEVAPVAHAPERRSRASFAWLAVAAVAIVGIVFATSRHPSGATLAAPAPAASTDARPMGLLDLPPPVSDHPDALVAYAEGMHALHDGAWGLAYDGFARAAAADPTLAIAHLRVAMTSPAFGGFSTMRIEYQKAAQLQMRLTPRDAALFDALEPTLQRTPPDYDAAVARLRHALERFPNDAELSYVLGFYKMYDFDVSLPALAHATTIDARYADAWEAQGRALGWAGKIDEARASFEHCLAIPTAVDCVYWLLLMDEGVGDCAACEADARQRIDRDPLGQWGYRYLADAVASRGGSYEGVRAALEQAWSKWDDRSMTEHDRAWERLSDEAHLAVWKGDFAAAEDFAQRALALGENDTEGMRHARPTRLLIQIALESGDLAKAAELADAFAKRADVWTMTEKGTYDKDAGELPWLMSVAYRGGKLSRQALERSRSDWVTKWRGGAQPGWSWVVAYADTAQTPDDAREALSKLGELGPLPPVFPAKTDPELDVGRVYALAGRPAEAEAYLQRAVASCVRLDDPFAHPRAELELGKVLEALGNVASACTAYQAVLEQWGAATRKSVTADGARARMKALSCAK